MTRKAAGIPAAAILDTQDQRLDSIGASANAASADAASADTEARLEPVPVAPSLSPKSSSKFGRQQSLAIRSPWLIAGLFVLPYLLLMLAWAFSNPPGAAPDESSHLVKALGMSRLDIGIKYAGASHERGNGSIRNDSISRLIPVPDNLVPHGNSCMAFRPAKSASCLPTTSSKSTELHMVKDPLGSYPPFLYVPMGLVASFANSPSSAFFLGRLFCALACAALLLVGAAHLTRWLGPKSLIGAFIGLTPMAVFCCSIVSTSGIELASSFAMACIAAVSFRHRESLHQPGVMALLAVVGSTLILSRQLGVVTFLLLTITMVARVGWHFCWALVREHRPSFLVTVGILFGCALAVALWERIYDHPVLTGGLSSRAFGAFASSSYSLVKSGVANFGWLDTAVPPWTITAWIFLFSLLVTLALMFTKPADGWTLVVWFAAGLVISWVTYAVVFYPVGASLQGRDVIALFIPLPVLAGSMISVQKGPIFGIPLRRLFMITAAIIPVFHIASIYINARRYAVGVNGPVWFLGRSQWTPVLGWWPWLALAIISMVMLAWLILRVGTSTVIHDRHVEVTSVDG